MSGSHSASPSTDASRPACRHRWAGLFVKIPLPASAPAATELYPCGFQTLCGDAAALFWEGWGTGMVTAFRLLLYQSPVFNHNLRTTVIYRLDGYALKRHRGQSDAAADDFRVLREKLNQSAGDLRGPRQSSMSTRHDSEQHSPADLSAVSQTARFVAFCSLLLFTPAASR